MSHTFLEFDEVNRHCCDGSLLMRCVSWCMFKCIKPPPSPDYMSTPTEDLDHEDEKEKDEPGKE